MFEATIVGTVLLASQVLAPVQSWEHWPGEWNLGRPSLAALVAEPSTTSPALATAGPSILIESPVFRLEVPFRTQKDGGRWQISNCGPATLGMVLDGYGIVGQATDDLRFRSHTYQGTVGMRTGTALQHIAQVAEDFGVPTSGLHNGAGGFNTWSMDDVRAQLRLGRPVMSLVRLYLLPEREGVGPRWGHYILITGLNDDGFFYSDSLQADAPAGLGRPISAQQLERAMYNSHIPGQAVAFGGPDQPRLRVWTPG